MRVRARFEALIISPNVGEMIPGRMWAFRWAFNA
jgi:hypothetical protein